VVSAAGGEYWWWWLLVVEGKQILVAAGGGCWWLGTDACGGETKNHRHVYTMNCLVRLRENQMRVFSNVQSAVVAYWFTQGSRKHLQHNSCATH
jgi:hypothetical protein